MKPLKKIVFIFSILGFFLSSYPAYAVFKTDAILSPYCSEATIRQLSGDALVSINTYQMSQDLKTYSITLDTNKMYLSELIEKMRKKQCFDRD